MPPLKTGELIMSLAHIPVYADTIKEPSVAPCDPCDLLGAFAFEP